MKTGNSKKLDLNTSLRTPLIFLLVLVLIASTVLSVRLGAWTGRGDRISLSAGGSNSILRVFSSPQSLRALNTTLSDQNYNIHDQNKIWQTETQVDIFSRSYYDNKNGLTVASSDGDKLIAPGTEGRYRFTVENTGKLPMYYELTFDSSMLASMHNVPMETRVYNGKGEYLFGSATQWMPLSGIAQAIDKQTLDPGKSLDYTFDWRWVYEGAWGDWADTLLGNQSAYNESHNDEWAGVDVKIMTVAEIEEAPVPTPTPTPETLPTIITPLADSGAAWALVNLISTILACLIGIYEVVIWSRGRKEDDDAKDRGIYETEDYEKRRKRRKNKIWDLLPAVVSIIVFILTEDMRLPMVWVDRWTILMLIFLLVSVLVGCFTRLKKVEEEEKEEESLPVS